MSPLVTQISWTNHLLIMSGSKSAEERHFYLSLCVKEHYSKRELERQMDSAYYERSMLSSKRVPPQSVPQSIRSSILDTYILEFWIFRKISLKITCEKRLRTISNR